MIPVYSISIPEYHVRSEPSHELIGAKIDAVVKENFLGKSVVIRCISSKEHPGKSLDELVGVIKKIGIDRYDPEIKGDRYENLQNKHIDLFGLDFKVTRKSKMLQQLIEPFYSWPLKENREPIRLDLVLIYDRAKLKRVIHTYDGKRKKRDGFIFKDSDNKRDALIGIIKIL